MQKSIETFRKVVSKLERFWASKGCAILNSYDMEMGAATFHPSNVLNAIKDNPSKIAFIQPCRRPQDSRGGGNPNRLYKFHQFQVLIMPPPKDIQTIVEHSLYECGIDPRRHNIDFVEDNWKSPSMGATGYGYEIRCNGMEVCQFTYFQQMAGKEVPLVSIELAYGVERLLLIAQNKDHVFDLVWDVIDDKEVTYGQINAEFEKEYSSCNYSVDLLKSVFNTYEEMCILASKSPQMLPAYEVFLKLSHTFNLIESSGCLSVNDRLDFLKRTRHCAKLCIRIEEE
jgi:glycyl-tRNA synthetase alpha chain